MARRRCAEERTERRQERLVGAGKPHGSRGSPADPPVPNRTDPETSARSVPPHGGPWTAETCGGDRGDAGRRGGSGWSAPKGNAPGPRHGRRPTSAPGHMCLERSGVSVFLTSCSSELEERKPCGNGSRSGAPTATWKAPRLGGRSGLGSAWEPHGRQRPSWPRSERGANRRGGGKPRGRNVPGEATPGRVDPRARVVEGA